MESYPTCPWSTFPTCPARWNRAPRFLFAVFGCGCPEDSNVAAPRGRHGRLAKGNVQARGPWTLRRGDSGRMAGQAGCFGGPWLSTGPCIISPRPAQRHSAAVQGTPESAICAFPRHTSTLDVCVRSAVRGFIWNSASQGTIGSNSRCIGDSAPLERAMFTRVADSESEEISG